MESVEFKIGDIVTPNGKYKTGSKNIHDGTRNGKLFRVVKSYSICIDVLNLDGTHPEDGSIGWFADGFELAEDFILKQLWKEDSK